MEFTELSDSELEVMEVLWEKGEPMSFGEIFEYFSTHTQKGWKKQTLNTFLFRMQQKNLLEVKMEGRYKQYIPAMTNEEYKIAESKAFLKKNYEGSFVKMLSALNGGERLRAEEITELKNLLKEWEKE